MPRLEVNPNGSWIDLYTREDVTLQAGEFAIIPLGVAMKLPEGYEANFVPRSSTFKRYKVLQTNAFSVIDPTYCGPGDEWGYPVYATFPVVIPKGTRLCQFRINKVQPHIIFDEVASLAAENRGGFGTSNTD
jgi:dUTP pyrophosphatase